MSESKQLPPITVPEPEHAAPDYLNNMYHLKSEERQRGGLWPILPFNWRG